MAKNNRKLVAVVGDVNPLQYGGMLVFEEQDARYFEAELIETDESGEGTPVEIYRFSLDRRQWLGDVEKKQDVLTLSHYSNQIPWEERADCCKISLGHGCPFAPSEYTEWWDEKLREIYLSDYGDECKSPSWEEYLNAQTSTNPYVIGSFYMDLVQHFGAIEFDQEPLKLSEKEAKARYSQVFSGARRRVNPKKRITVYA